MMQKRYKKRSLFFDIVDNVTALGLKVGGTLFVLILGYLIYGLLAKHGLLSASQLPRADYDRVVSNVIVAGKLLGITGAIVALCTAIRYCVEESLGYLMSLLGVLLYFGIPWLFSCLLSKADQATSYAVGPVVLALQLLGVIFFAPGAVLILFDFWPRVRRAFAKPVKKDVTDGSFIVGAIPDEVQEPYQPTLYAKCWQTPYCKKFVRGACPAYDKRKSCWRCKSGCMCDPKVIERALAGQSSEGRMFMRELQFRSGEVPTRKKVEPTPAEKRARCRTCVIYDFHQKQKYKLISPFIVPAVVGLIWKLYPSLLAIIRSALELTERFVQRAAFLPQAQNQAVSEIPEVVLVMFVVWLGVIAVSYALKLLEFCIFKVQI